MCSSCSVSWVFDDILQLPKQGYYDFDQLSGSMSRDKRDSAVQGLLEGRHKAMLTTDVLARGFDWPQVNAAFLPILDSIPTH